MAAILAERFAMNDKTDFANLIAQRLQTAEQALDQALAEISLLTHDMTRHRAGASFAAQAGHQALIDAHAAAGALVEGRTRLVASHDRLARTARALGIAVTAGGPLEGKDQPQPRTAARTLGA